MYRFLKKRKQSFNGCRSVIMNNGKKFFFFFKKKLLNRNRHNTIDTTIAFQIEHLKCVIIFNEYTQQNTE